MKAGVLAALEEGVRPPAHEQPAAHPGGAGAGLPWGPPVPQVPGEGRPKGPAP